MDEYAVEWLEEVASEDYDTEEIIAGCWNNGKDILNERFETYLEDYAPCGLNDTDSMEAAKEHYAFCPDRIDQGTRTYKVSELAAGLVESDVWYFWLDERKRLQCASLNGTIRFHKEEVRKYVNDKSRKSDILL